MKTIKIINGVYGYRPDGGPVAEPKSADDAPFEVSDEEAARLVKLKVAKIVETETEDAVADQQTDTAQASGQAGGTDGKLPAYDVSMKLAELKEIAKLYGVSEEALAGLRAKKDVVAAIEAEAQGDTDTDQTDEDADLENDEDDEDAVEDDGEQPPDLNAVDPV